MRYHPLTATDRTDMLARVGVSDIDALFAGVPQDKLLRGPVALQKGTREGHVRRHSHGRTAPSLKHLLVKKAAGPRHKG